MSDDLKVVTPFAVNVRIIDVDEVTPTEIEHKSEEIYAGDALQQRYNYLVYHFDITGRYFWARTYLDNIGVVSVFGPFQSRLSKTPVPGHLDDGVLSYLKRRFKEIQTFGRTGYETVWSREG
jgi:hypothetical protein